MGNGILSRSRIPAYLKSLPKMLLIADAEHLEHLKISDDDDDNKDSVKNTGETLFKLNYTFNTTGAKASDYLTACSDLNVNSDNPIVANLTLKSWQVTEVAWKLTQELSPVRDEILANKVRLEKTAQYCTLILKVKEQNILSSREITDDTLKKFIVN
ncbi:conserved hypothetical protein [Coccidioides posadasii str. Silveira]|uniref:Uncharacterized protein n=1 Tax=Coccidioides posadasii (strain RMSCC 757 / Silveira) TaxID=443226 RepID=E9DJQ3_COCPS|nr:conserved hypothetical protein [Coccidioides posadasii str. Silveira]